MTHSMSERPVPVIAIDGPSASGKGTIAKRVAQTLGFRYLESGALYRLVALASLDRKAAANEEASLVEIAATLPAEFDEDRIFLAGKDVTDAIRDEAVGIRASEIAPLAAVRMALLGRQRSFRKPPGLVAEGRDMGSVVFPDAVLKVFLTASVEERARRRHKQLIDKGIHATLRTLFRDLAERDRRDAARSVAPLVAASDAVHIDATNLSVQDVVAEVVERFRKVN
ncbi:MAG TPA: (d)CMP kinase [Burkholderiales bacterium]|nr:(d)CMP kinase [Burkholderiales bacterium]